MQRNEHTFLSLQLLRSNTLLQAARGTLSFFPVHFFVFNSFLLCSSFEICFAEVYIVISASPFIIGFGFMFVAVISNHQMKLQINDAPLIASDGSNTF